MYWQGSKGGDAPAARHPRFLCVVAGSPLLKPATRRASIWEIAIKSRLGKIKADPDELAQAIETSGFFELQIKASHTAGVARLKLHHGDPFDRLSIPQAIAEPLRLLTADAALAQHSDLVMLA